MRNLLAPWSPHLLSVLRIVTGLLILEYGTAKYLGFPHNPIFDHLTLMSPGGVGGVIELVGGALLTLGLFTRIAAFIMSGEMAVAYFLVHAPQSFFPQISHGDLAVMFCFTLLYISAAGPGRWSVDALRESRTAGGRPSA